MFEANTFDEILQALLSYVPDGVDKREGSLIYTTLAPVAAQFAQMYISLDMILTESFIDTADGNFLDQRANEIGIIRLPATRAVRNATFTDASGNNVSVDVGQRFGIGDLVYDVTQITANSVELTCETAGSVGNTFFGTMQPVDYIANLNNAELGDIVVAGVDAETDDELRSRYMELVGKQPFGGNIADYTRQVMSVAGVGACNITPAWNGGGTVLVQIIDKNFNPPEQSLVDSVQTLLDPTTNSGVGAGLAPIGHVVTVNGVAGVALDVDVTIVYADGVDQTLTKSRISDAISNYFLELRQNWSKQTMIVRTAKIVSAAVDVIGVSDCISVTIEGNSANFTLAGNQVPILGSVSVNV